MELLQKICGIASGVLGLYSVLILIRIVISWILLIYGRSGRREGMKGLISVNTALGKICDPYLKLFRGVSSLRRSRVDLTPVLALLVLNFVRSLLSAFAELGTMSGGIVLAVLIDVTWESLGSFILFVLIVLLIIRFVLGRSNSPDASGWINNTLDPILEPAVTRVYKLFYRKKRVDDQKIVLASIIFYLVLLIALGLGVNFLVGLLMTL